MNKLSLLIATIIGAFLFIGCHEPNPEPNKNCCEGYTGKMKSKMADSLIHKDNFIIKDSIDSWTNRYQANVKLIHNDSLGMVGKVLGDSSSFNRCIIKAIICDDNCIGLRVVYGMSPEMKLHVILVGVKPDYSTLYIKRPEACYKKTKEMDNTSQLTKVTQVASMFGGTTSGSMSDIGGAEYGMEP